MNCPTCVRTIEDRVTGLPGIDRVQVNFVAERVTVDYMPGVTGPDAIA